MMRKARPTVAIVIPCYEQKRFLAGAIESAIRQQSRPTEIIVVDDGSTEDVSGVVARYPDVRLIRQENRGLASARNCGLRAAGADKIIFLDADDRLFPRAVAVGLGCFAKNPDAAFVYGAFEEVRGSKAARRFCRVTSHRDLVLHNWIGMIATVMFDREKLLGEGGFDETLGMTEDWDAYLRLSRRFPFAAHNNKVAQYVRHESNMSNSVADLKHWIDVVRDKEWERGLDGEGQRAWHDGEELWRETLEGTSKTPPTLASRAIRKAVRLAGLARKG